MSNRITISGGVVAEPELKVISDKFKVLEFPLYDNEQRKDKDTGVYADVPGSTLKLKVVLKNDLADTWYGKIRKGDIVELACSITEREYERKDGQKGRALETTFVNEVTVKWSKSGATASGDEPF